MKNNHVVSLLILFIVFSGSMTFAGGLIDAARDIASGALNFAGEVVEKTGQVVHDVAEKTAEIVTPTGQTQEPVVVEKEVTLEEVAPETASTEHQIPHEPVISAQPEIPAATK